MAIGKARAAEAVKRKTSSSTSRCTEVIQCMINSNRVIGVASMAVLKLHVCTRIYNVHFNYAISVRYAGIANSRSL